MEWLHKKGLKQAARQLSRYRGANDYVIASVTQQSLGGHAIPVDAPTLRTLRRMGFIEEAQEDGEALRASLEHQIPKARGQHFTEVLSILATEYCWEGEPNCASCPMAKLCPTAHEAAEVAVPAARAKPR
jgi:endonuclease-3